MSIFLSHMDTAPAEYHVIVLLSYLISIDPLIFNCFDVHRIWIWVSYVEFDPSAVLRGDAVVFALVHVCHASGLRSSSFMTLRVAWAAYYKSLQNQAVLCSTIKSSAKNQTKDCPIVQTFYILHQRYVSYYISVETYALHHLSSLWDIVFEGNRWLKYHERCLVLSYYQSPPEKMSACSTIAHSLCSWYHFFKQFVVCPFHLFGKPGQSQLRGGQAKITSLNVDPRNPWRSYSSLPYCRLIWHHDKHVLHLPFFHPFLGWFSFIVTCDMWHVTCPASINWLKCHWGCGRRCGCRRCHGCRGCSCCCRCCCGCGCGCCGCGCGCCGCGGGGCGGLCRGKDRTTPGCLILRCIVGADAWQMSEHAMVTFARNYVSICEKLGTCERRLVCIDPRACIERSTYPSHSTHRLGWNLKKTTSTTESQRWALMNKTQLKHYKLTGTAEVSNWRTAGFTQKTQDISPASQIRASSSKGFDDNFPNVRSNTALLLWL